MLITVTRGSIAFRIYEQRRLRRVSVNAETRKNRCFSSQIVSEYDQEIPQSQTADNPMASRGRADQPSRDTKKTNQAKKPALSPPSRWLQY